MTDAQMLKTYWDIEGWLYGGDRDTEVNYRRADVVRVRFPQLCSGAYHKDSLHESQPLGKREMPAGTRMVCERAVVDGDWCSCYTCEGCIVESVAELATH